MAAAVGLRGDYDAGTLRAAAKHSNDGPQARRLLALAAIYDGATSTEAAKIGGVGLQVVRDWVLKFNARGPDLNASNRQPHSFSSRPCTSERGELGEIVRRHASLPHGGMVVPSKQNGLGSAKSLPTARH